MNALKRLSRVLSASLVCGVAVLLGSAAPLARAAGGTEPYFKVFGGSVFVGGAFSSAGSGSGCSSGYQISSPGDSSMTGGILSYSTQKGSNYVGATSQYDSYATGPVDFKSANNFGFFTGGSKDTLTFANHTPPANTLGGYFDGGTPQQADCIPDYFDTNQNRPLARTNDVMDLSNLSQPQFLVTPASGLLTLKASNPIPAGQSLTVFVQGNLYINSDITYGSYTDTTVPKLALVVKGNVFVDPGVHTLDGLYISQPTDAAGKKDGIFWTCHSNDASQDSKAGFSTWIAGNCGNKLTINGALISRQVNFTRTNGDVVSANPSEDTLAGAQSSANIAELINYNPSMVIGGGFFSQSAPTYRIDSLVSLPPIF